MILNLTYLFDLMAENPDAFEKGVELVKRGEVQWLPTPVVAEAYSGIATTPSETINAELRNPLLGYPESMSTRRSHGSLVSHSPTRTRSGRIQRRHQ